MPVTAIRIQQVLNNQMESLTEGNIETLVMLYYNTTVLYYILIVFLHSYVNSNSYEMCSRILAEF